MRGIDTIDPAYCTIRDGDGQTEARREAGLNVGGHPRPAAHPFYVRLNQILEQHDFDAYVEGLCARFYADDGRPGLPPGRYFRLLLIGYFEGLDAERPDRLAGGRFVCVARVSRVGFARGTAGSFDDFPYASPD